MEATVLNLFNSPETPPAQTLEVFCRAYAVQSVREQLLGVFRLAILGGLEENREAGLTTDDVASLFDQLISVTTAVHALRHNSGAPCTAGRRRKGV